MKDAQMSKKDEVTGLPGYQAFVESLDGELAAAEEAGRGVSVALVDIDWFKRINDEHGKLLGDEVLRCLTEHLAATAPDNATVFRYGGDELVVLMPGIEKEQAFLRMEQARSAFDKEHVFAVSGSETRLPVTVSIGIASCPEDGARSQELLRKAGDAVHRAKAAGRNRLCLAREERMVTKTSHYTQGQLQRLGKLAERESVGEAVLLREALDDMLRKNSI